MLATTGRVLHNAVFYDLTVWLFTGGKERAFREKVVALANLRGGEAILDIGCGTGSQAIAACRCIGSSGSVTALDASAEMLERARSKARKASMDISFVQGAAERLPFRDDQFDIVLSTVMLHHLPRKIRKESLAEIRRVLKPGGRVVIVDFEGTADQSKGIVALVSRHKHGHVASEQLSSDMEEAGLRVERTGQVGVSDLHFTIANCEVGS
jgi:ubiquinone/menaquinone biosynthesis C-methylase UbiE